MGPELSSIKPAAEAVMDYDAVLNKNSVVATLDTGASPAFILLKTEKICGLHIKLVHDIEIGLEII